MPKRCSLVVALMLGCSAPAPSTGPREQPRKIEAPQQHEPLVECEPLPAPIDLTTYDHACTTDADCIVVRTQPCEKCGCGDRAIAASEEPRFRAAAAAVQCQPCHRSYDIECADCTEPTARCDAGECKLER